MRPFNFRMGIPSPSSTGDLWYAFLSILMEGAPYILIGSLVSGVIDAWLPSNAMDRLLPRKAAPAIFLSGFLGIIFPVCECAIVPVIRRLVQKGLPMGCAMTYMLAAPIVNPIVGFSTWSAFQGRMTPDGGSLAALMTESRMIMGYIVAVLAGLIMSRLPVASVLRPEIVASLSKGSAGGGAGKSKTSQGAKLTHAMATAQRDFVDVAVYFVIGVLIAAIMQTQVIYRAELQENIRGIAHSTVLGPAVLMVFAFILSLCSTTDAFIIAADSLFPNVAKLAFLVFGPMLDMKLLFLYTTVLKQKAVAVLAAGLFVVILCLTLAFGATVFAEKKEPPKLGPPALNTK